MTGLWFVPLVMFAAGMVFTTLTWPHPHGDRLIPDRYQLAKWLGQLTLASILFGGLVGIIEVVTA